MSEFDVFARFYDLDFQNENEDIDFYRNFARRSGSPILEIGSGTGRVLVPLAQDGWNVTGVDISPAMIDVARRKVAQAHVADRVELLLADARSLNTRQRYQMAFVAVNSFMHFLTDDDQIAVLEAIRQHLVPEGFLLIDVFNPHHYVDSRTDGYLIHEYTRKDPATGNTVVKLVSRQTDEALQMVDVTFMYDDIASSDGTVRRTIAPFSVHYFTYPELSRLLQATGFRVEHVYGSYDLDTYQSYSSRMIFVAAKNNG